MEQPRRRIPKGAAAGGRPTPVAIGMQHDPGLAPEAGCEMRDHGVRTNAKVEPLQASGQQGDIRRVDVYGPDLLGRPRGAARLQRIELRAGTADLPEQFRGNHPPPVPSSHVPDQPDRKGGADGRHNLDPCHTEIWPPDFSLLTRSPDRMRNFHDLNVDIEIDLGRSLVQRQNAISPLNRCDQRQQFRLTPNHDFGCDRAQWCQEAGELQGVAKAVVTPDENPPPLKRLTAPDALEMTGTLMLGRPGTAQSGEIAITDVPRPRKIAGPHGCDPVRGHAALIDDQRRTNLWKRLTLPSLVRSWYRNARCDSSNFRKNSSHS